MIMIETNEFKGGMMKVNAIDWVAITILVLAGLNWALVGLIDMNLVSYYLGDQSIGSRLLYILAGMAAFYITIVMPKKIRDEIKNK